MSSALCCLLQYLERVECPIPFKPGDASSEGEVLLWLLKYAVHLEYTDRGASSHCSSQEVDSLARGL